MGVKLFYSLKADSKIIPFFLAPTAQYLQFAHFNFESSINRVAKKGIFAPIKNIDQNAPKKKNSLA